MSQFELSEASSPVVPTGATEAIDDQAAQAATSAALLSRAPMRSTFHKFSQSRTTLMQPDRSLDESGAVVVETHRRRVGFQYLFQLASTAIPLVIVDLALLTGSIVVARAAVRYFGFGIGIDISDFFLPIATGFLVVAFEMGLYPGIRLSPVEEFRRLSVSITAMFAMWAVAVMMIPGFTTNPEFLVLAYLLSLISLPVFRGTVRRLLAMCPWWGFPTLVCGDDAVVGKVYQWLVANRRLGLRPVGVIANPEVAEIGADEPWYAGSWTEAEKIANERGVYWAVVVPPDGAASDITTMLTEHLSTIPHIHILTELTGLPDHWARNQQFDGLAGIHLQQNLMLPLPRITKRCMDIFGAIAGCILLSPLLFYIAVAVKMSSRGPVLFPHERIGKDGRRFRAWKFRTMFQNASVVLEQYLDVHPEMQEEWQRDHKLRHDPRITRIGRFLRKTSLDELPQLWNVLRGEMSMVGPRPIVTAEIPKYGPYYGLFTMVTPGITGLWQVSGRNNTTYEERVQLDSYYVRNWSLWLDIFLLLKTVRIVLFSRGAY